mgnify:FL=1|tara:strand:- start:28 stop:762 length:735 start_codon:yes stop_codon:yes gene_type:complete
MPDKIFYNKYPPSIGNSEQEKDLNDYYQRYWDNHYWDIISDLNKKIEDDPINGSLYIERAIFRDSFFCNEINLIESETISEYNLKKRRQYKLILADFEDALFLEPYNDIYWYQTGLFVQDVGGAQIYGDDHINLSIPFFTNAINLNSKDHKYFYSRAISYQISKKHVEAIKDFNIAISLHPSKGKCHKAEYFNERAFTKGYGLNDWEGALNDNLQALKINSDPESNEEILFDISNCKSALNNQV